MFVTLPHHNFQHVDSGFRLSLSRLDPNGLGFFSFPCFSIPLRSRSSRYTYHWCGAESFSFLASFTFCCVYERTLRIRTFAILIYALSMKFVATRLISLCAGFVALPLPNSWKKLLHSDDGFVSHSPYTISFRPRHPSDIIILLHSCPQSPR